MTMNLSAGVYENIIDESYIVDGAAQMTGGIVVTASRGPVEPTRVTSAEQLASLYGFASRDNPSMYAAQRFMRTSGILTVRRVINDATVASGSVTDGSSATVATIEAASPGSWGNEISVRFADIVGSSPATTPTAFVVVVLENDEEVERFEVSRNPDEVDGFGNPLFIEDVINGRSRYITVEDDPTIAGSYDRTATVSLTGGTDDSVAPTSVDIAAAWDDFLNEEEIRAEILINGGFAVADVQSKMIEVAEARANCRAILDVPLDRAESVSDMIDWRQGYTTSTNRAAMYGGWIRVYDSYTNREVTIPPSGDVAAAIVRTFRDFDPWDAPAGMRRGIINALGVTKIFNESERDDLYVNGINPVTTYGGVSAVIWGQKTMQYEKSAMDRLNVVNNVLWITESMTQSLVPFTFEPNTQFTRDNVNYILTQFLEGVQTRGGLYAYRVDTESGNTPQVIDQNQMIVGVWVQPTRTAEFIRLNVTITPTGVELDSL